MKKIISTLLLSVILCSLYAQNKAGGNVNSKEPIAYADKEFLTGILDYDSLKNTPAPQNWPEPLNNTFKFTYVTGECRMIPSQFLFDAAKKLGVEKEFTYNCEFHDGIKPYVKLAAIFIQKVQNEVYYRAFYKAEDIIPDEVKNGNLPSWIYNTDPVSIFQKIYFKDGSSVTVYHSTYSMQETNTAGPEPYTFKFKLYGNFDILDSNHFAFSNFVFNDFESKVYSSGLAYYNKPKDSFTLNATFDFANYLKINTSNGKRYNDCFSCFGIPLIEKNYSRYSIINMFDNNPETSFVEDETDDNIYLRFNFDYPGESIKKIKIINGYAQSEDLYYKNNRVRSLNLEVSETEKIIINLKETLNIQTFETNLFTSNLLLDISSTELFNGSKYNDTCIAEFDILTDDGWLISDN